MNKKFLLLLIIISVIVSQIIICYLLLIKRNNIYEKKAYSLNSNTQNVYTNKKQFDFGVVNEGQIVVGDFLFYNNGESDIEIQNMSRCSCLKIDIEKKTIPSHKSSNVKVEFGTFGRKEGMIEQEVLIKTSDINNPMVKLIMKGYINKYLSIIPDNIWIGEVIKNKVISRNIIIKSYDKNLEITNMRLPQNIRASIGNIIEEKDKKIININITIKTDSILGNFENNLTFITNSKYIPEINAKVYGAVVNEIKAVPLYAEFGQITKNKQYEQNIKIILRESNVKIDSVKTSSNLIIAQLKSKNKKEYNLLVKLLITGEITKINEFVTIYTNKKNSNLIIPVIAKI